MTEKLKDPTDIKAITAFIAKELSWKKLYYDKLSTPQKVRCLLPAFLIIESFLGLSIGCMMFFMNDFRFHTIALPFSILIIFFGAFVVGVVRQRQKKYRNHTKDEYRIAA